MKKLVVIIILIALLALPVLAQYQVGDTVPNFTLRNSNNTPVSLYSYTNKIMLLLFWTPG